MSNIIACPHQAQRQKKCGICGQCSRCHYDDCNGEHSTALGAAGAAIRERRKQARLQQQQQPEDSARSYELRQNRPGDLREDRLFEKLDGALANENDDANTQGGPFAELSKALSMEPSNLSGRVVDRKSLYDLASLQTVGTLTNVVVGMEHVLRHIVRQVTSCVESFTLVFNGIVARWSERRPDEALASVAMSFIRASDPMNERFFFAILIHSSSVDDRKILEDALMDARSKALVDREFTAVAQPRYYYVTKTKGSSSGEADEEDDDEEEDSQQDAEPGTARVRVTLDVADQLRKKVRWLFSKQKLARAQADWQRIRFGQKLEPKWNKSSVSS